MAADRLPDPAEVEAMIAHLRFLASFPVDEAKDLEDAANMLAALLPVSAAVPPAEPPTDLPERIVVGANGAYWRDYGEFYSMCPVSTDNDPVDVIAVYELVTGADKRPSRMGTTVPSPELLAEYGRELETMRAAHAPTDEETFCD